MKKLILIGGMSLLTNSVVAANHCFLAQENKTVLKQEGNECNSRYTPQSTFKIPLSLMGFDSGILQDETHPVWNYKKEYDLYVQAWKYPQNPHTWLRDSCVWYSQVLTQKLGMKRFTQYVKQFHYGNENVSGNKGKQDGLIQSWLSSSLEISPKEQVLFLQHMLNGELSLSPEALEKTKKIMFVEELVGGWKLYAKTGTGVQANSSNKKTALQQGWFVGWIEKNNRKIVFADHLSDQKTVGGLRAKNDGLIRLWALIDELEK